MPRHHGWWPGQASHAGRERLSRWRRGSPVIYVGLVHSGGCQRAHSDPLCVPAVYVWRRRHLQSERPRPLGPSSESILQATTMAAATCDSHSVG